MPAPNPWREEFPTLGRSVYLNTCSLGALSRRSRQAMDMFQAEWEARGAAAWYDTWWERLAQLRAGYAGVIGARPDEIALHASISTAAAVMASALDYRQRPKVVTTSLDFPTVAYQWLARRRAGVELTIVESPDGITVPVERIADAVDDRTALVATSHVYFATGARQDVAAVASAAHRHGALTFIDGYHAAGQIPVDVAGAGVDFYAGGGLKWLLGGPGIAFLYARSALLAGLAPDVTGWFAHARQFDFDPHALDRHPDARRLEMGTPALAAVHAQLGALELLAEVGWPTVFAKTAVFRDRLIADAADRGFRPRVAADPAARTGVVTLPHADPERCVAGLAAEGIIVDARPGHVRASPFFYNSDDEIEAFLEAFARHR